MAPHCAIPGDYLSDTPLSVFGVSTWAIGWEPLPTNGVSQRYLRENLRKQGKRGAIPILKILRVVHLLRVVFSVWRGDLLSRRTLCGQHFPALGPGPGRRVGGQPLRLKPPVLPPGTTHPHLSSLLPAPFPFPCLPLGSACVSGCMLRLLLACSRGRIRKGYLLPGRVGRGAVGADPGSFPGLRFPLFCDRQIEPGPG